MDCGCTRIAGHGIDDVTRHYATILDGLPTQARDPLPHPPGEEPPVGDIRVHEFMTLDGVVDAPRWTFDYGFPADLAAAIGSLTAYSSALLLGRNTFEMYAPAWSSRTVQDDPAVGFYNGSRKYVVSRTLADAEAVWSNSTVLGGYASTRMRALKRSVPGDLYVSGSITLVRALLADGLVDELHLFVYPVAVGGGIRLFPEGGARRPLSLLGADTLSNGVMHVVYGPERAASRAVGAGGGPRDHAGHALSWMT